MNNLFKKEWVRRSDIVDLLGSLVREHFRPRTKEGRRVKAEILADAEILRVNMQVERFDEGAQLEDVLKSRGFQREGVHGWRTHYGKGYPDLKALLDDQMFPDIRVSKLDPKGAQYGAPLQERTPPQYLQQWRAEMQRMQDLGERLQQALKENNSMESIALGAAAERVLPMVKAAAAFVSKMAEDEINWHHVADGSDEDLRKFEIAVLDWKRRPR